MTKRSKKPTSAKPKSKPAKALNPEQIPTAPLAATPQEAATHPTEGEFPFLAQSLLETTRSELMKNNRDGESILKTMSGFPDSLIAQVLLTLTAEMPELALPLLTAAANHESPQVILAVIRALSRIRCPEAAAVLGQIEDATRWDTEKTSIRKELNRALHRFKSMGITPPRPALDTANAENSAAAGQRTEASPLVSAERQFHQALVSNLDGVGNILGILVMRSPGSKYETAVLLFSDLDGIKDCKVYSFNQRQLDGFLKEWDLETTGVGLVPVDRDYLDYLVNEHLPLNRANNTPLAPDFVAWRRYFKITDNRSTDLPQTERLATGQITEKMTGQTTGLITETTTEPTTGQLMETATGPTTEPPAHPVYALIPREGAEESLSYLLPRTETLIQTPEMRNWLIEPSLINEYAQKLLDRRQSRIMVGGSFLQEFKNKLALEAAEQLFTAEFSKRYARRLEHMAFVFSLKGQVNQARLSLAASLHLQEGQNPVKNPVLWALTLHSLDVLTDLLALGNQAAEQNPAQAEPKAEPMIEPGAEVPRANPLKPSPLILR